MRRTRRATSCVLRDFPESSHHLYRQGVSMLPLGDIGAMCGDIFGATGPEWVVARGSGDSPTTGSAPAPSVDGGGQETVPPMRQGA